MSRATAASELIKLLKVTAYMDRQDVAHKVLEYLKHAQKVAHLTNEEISDLYTSLVLVRFGNDRVEMAKFLKTTEYLLLRRIHSMTSK